MATMTENWSVGDYLSHFEKEITRAVEPRFKEQFKELAGELEHLDSEFLLESAGCGAGLDPILEQLHSLAGRLGYCERPRGFEKECDLLFGDVQKAIGTVKKFRSTCST